MLHKLEHRVLPEEVDAFLVVNFSNYLKWCSMTLVDFMRENGVGLKFERDSVEFRVARINANYVSSARLEDVITIYMNSFEMKRKKLELSFVIKENERILTRVKLAVAFVFSENAGLTEIPQELQDVIMKHAG